MIVNSFFSKNNTIFSNSDANTGNNPVIELYYGSQGEFSRCVFTINWMELFEKFKSNFINNSNPHEELQHVLKMTNTSFYAYNLHRDTYLDYTRAKGFDLILYVLDEGFDEGNGYDQNKMGLTTGRKVYNEVPSNFKFKTLNNEWKSYGGFDTRSVKKMSYNDIGEVMLEYLEDVTDTDTFEDEFLNKVLAIQHFGEGSENLEMDISDFVNNRLLEMMEYYQNNNLERLQYLMDNTTFCLGFTPDLENSNVEDKYYVGFFSRHSISAYSPFIQTLNLNYIDDDRFQVIDYRENKIYHYNDKHGLENYMEKPSVILVKDPEGSFDECSDNVIAVIDSEFIKNPGTGIYYFDFVPDGLSEDCSMIYDVWTGMRETPYGIEYITTTDSFNVIESSETQVIRPYDRAVVIYYNGIDSSEKINRGEVKKFTLTPKIKFTNNTKDFSSKYYYRIYAKEGRIEIPIVEYQRMNKTKDFDRYFHLDTNSFLPNDYFIDIKVETPHETVVKKEMVNFTIVAISKYAVVSKGRTKGMKVMGIKKPCDTIDSVFDDGSEPLDLDFDF